MKNLLLIPLLLSLTLTSQAFAQKAEKFKLPNAQWLVVSEGALENASIGSYSMTIFNDENLVDFVEGAIFSRDGSLFTDGGAARIEFLDINQDGQSEIIVTKLTAGSGRHLEIDLIISKNNQLQRVAKTSGTNREEMMTELKQQFQDKQF